MIQKGIYGIIYLNMPYGKVPYDPIIDSFRCEYPVKDSSGNDVPCGKWCRDLARHITRHHKITVREYKQMFGLNMNASLISKSTKEKLRQAVQKHKTYVNLEKGKKYRFKKGETTVQNYKRSAQTKSRLRKLRSK